MATITQTRRGSGGFLVVAAILGGLVLVAMLGQAQTVTVMPSAEHAMSRHGEEALAAAAVFAWPQRADKDCIPCRDGRVRCVRYVTGRGYAVAVYETGTLVTAFFTRDTNYVRRVLDVCSQSGRDVPHDGHS